VHAGRDLLRLPTQTFRKIELLRCPAGEVLPTAALDALVSQGNNALVDIRAGQEKEIDGVPDLAYSGA
jgi:hypothetical protein